MLTVHKSAGVHIDANQAAYYAPALSEHELHPAWSMYHQQQQLAPPAAAQEPAREPAQEAAQHLPDADKHQRPHRSEQPSQGRGQTAPQQAPSVADVAAGTIVRDDQLPVAAQPDAHLVNRLQQGLAKARRRLTNTLDNSKAAAEKMRSSSAKLIKDMGLPWDSPQNWVPSPWSPSQITPSWPAQPVTPVQRNSSADSSAAFSAQSAQAAAEVPPVHKSRDPLSDQDSSGDTPEAAMAGADAPSAVAVSQKAQHLLASFRLHTINQPCVLATLDAPISSSLPSMQDIFASTGESASAVQSTIQIPGSDAVVVSQGEPPHTDPHHDADCISNPEQNPTYDGTATPSDPDIAQKRVGETHAGEVSYGKQESNMMSSEPAAPASSSRLARTRSGSPGGREEMVIEPKYTPGVPAPPRGTLQISATAGAAFCPWVYTSFLAVQ